MWFVLSKNFHNLFDNFCYHAIATCCTSREHAVLSRYLVEGIQSAVPIIGFPLFIAIICCFNFLPCYPVSGKYLLDSAAIYLCGEHTHKHIVLHKTYYIIYCLLFSCIFFVVVVFLAVAAKVEFIVYVGQFLV